MTAPIPAAVPPQPLVLVQASDLRAGCTGCGSQKTVVLHPRDGRRCPACMTIPPGRFRQDLADDMVELGRVDAAFAYLGGWLAGQIDRRFELATDRIAVAW